MVCSFMPECNYSQWSLNNSVNTAIKLLLSIVTFSLNLKIVHIVIPDQT